MTGTLYGVGLGPGDPELLTLKAHRLINSAKIIAYPAPDNGESFARSIAAPYIAPEAEEIPIVIPMRVERFPAQDVYDAAARTLGARLSNGEDVVVLCEGDPFFYGSFMYLFQRFADRFPVECVPGVTSMTACSAVIQQPLCARNEALSVVPAPLSEAELTSRLSSGGAFAIIKVGRHIDKVRHVIAGLQLMDRSMYVSHASLPNQLVCPLHEAPEKAPYFSMVIISGTDPYAVS
ncbi:MAG: precorrin-2 C(20)-methyltransferase [Cohaesibacteraceae bacterium]